MQQKKQKNKGGGWSRNARGKTTTGPGRSWPSPSEKGRVSIGGGWPSKESGVEGGGCIAWLAGVTHRIGEKKGASDSSKKDDSPGQEGGRPLLYLRGREHKGRGHLKGGGTRGGKWGSSQSQTRKKKKREKGKKRTSAGGEKNRQYGHRKEEGVEKRV